jgi:linear primary-alkylsulfatase
MTEASRNVQTEKSRQQQYIAQFGLSAAKPDKILSTRLIFGISLVTMVALLRTPPDRVLKNKKQVARQGARLSKSGNFGSKENLPFHTVLYTHAPHKEAPMRRFYLSGLIVILAATAVIGYILLTSRVKRSQPPVPVGANADLKEHGKIFRKGVVKVTDGVYSAIGYGISNSIMIEGRDGIIIVDTMTTKAEAAEVLAEFRKITAKPVKAIIYTHSHPDHIFGAEVFAEGGHPEIYAQEDLEAHVKKLANEMRQIIGSRSLRMYGNFLPPGQLINVGIGPQVGMKPGSELGFLPPTRVFSDSLQGEAAGIRFTLVHAPGETEDQLYVWLPEKKTLLCGDNFYWAFPNLYTIRGTVYRSPKDWYQSIDKMRRLHAEYLVPSHTRPIIGADRIERILTDYRDAIQYVYDQSIRAINAGLTPDQMAETIKLPPHLARAPYLQPFYGDVSWCVRSIFDGNLGWFNGDSASLQPLSPQEEAKLMARLAGGRQGLVNQARQLLSESQYQAALQLTGYIFQLNPGDETAKDIRIKALTALAGREQNPNARNYYLTEALEIRDGFVSHESSRPSPEYLESLPLSGFFDLLAVNLDPQASANVNEKAALLFPDRGKAFLIHVRYGVAEMSQLTAGEIDQANPDIKVIADAMVFKEMLARIKSPLAALAGFKYPKGNSLSFGRFMKLFSPPGLKIPFEPLSPPRS